MSYLFTSTHTKLSSGDREVTIEPVLSFGIDGNGWHAAGIYKIHAETASIGQIFFEGNQWRYEGNGLSETEQEELACFIRFYDGKAA
ncbi:hypothetical protein [Mucilaginibacter myungsuensis]|uniref:Uncharacterized protein n=1 Tax=Mucilaginibacter myungsuensis TaxID=649104 RepID=A0A929PX98_9SPHI|nr:hypothetical protein [Mucilaginibacter myungsuensis]MBE9663633.1 hypothetical protein [Mucilaginibacter myungsuensis]MDN3599043.1 hypothetical protein [Mucilaginibacter myungsuensis]